MLPRETLTNKDAIALAFRRTSTPVAQLDPAPPPHALETDGGMSTP